EGLPGGKADAGREDPPDLRGHGAGAAARHRPQRAGPLSVRRFPGAALLLAASAACGANTRDVVPESHDTVVTPERSARPTGEYEYVAKRPLAVVALAEARGVPADAAQAAIDRPAGAADENGRASRRA